MKRISTLFFLLAISVFVFAMPVTSKPSKSTYPNASDILVPIGSTGKHISLMDLSVISIKELETFTGKKMKFADKVTFRLAQKQLRNSINPDGTLNDKKLAKKAKKVSSADFNIGGFALGFLLGLIGVLIAYLISDDNKKARVKWAWLGFAAWLVILLVILLV